MSGNGGANGTLTSMELSMILGEANGGWELKADAGTAFFVLNDVSVGAEAERKEDAACWFGFHWGALKLDLRSGNGGGRGRVRRGGSWVVVDAGWDCDCDGCGGGGGGGGGWKALCVEGAVRGRSRLTRSAKDGAVGGTTGNPGMGSSTQRRGQHIYSLKVRHRQKRLTRIVRSRRAAQANARPRLE